MIEDLHELSSPDRDILKQFICFPESFSIDLFSGHPPSRLLSMLSWLERRRWLQPADEAPGRYLWTPQFPRRKVITDICPEGMAPHHRNCIGILMKHLPPGDERILAVADQLLLAGLREGDLESILQAGRRLEENHRISSAIRLYDAILDFIETRITGREEAIAESMWDSFIKAIERRASFMLLHPNTKKIDRLLSMALDRAERLGDMRSQASLKLLIGQNDWMWFRYGKAIDNFNQGWTIISQIGDEELQKRGLKLQGLLHAIRGQLYQAIESYERYLGELESIANDDFSQLAALNLALCYAQTGMPQRALGIADTIKDQCEKNENWALASFALATSGMILLEVRQFSKCRTYFEQALAIAETESIPMVQVMSGIGLAGIECHKGNFGGAADHFKLIWKIRKSSWYHILNLYHLFDTGIILHAKGVSPVDMRPLVTFLNQIKKEAVNPLIYCNIQRLQLVLQETDAPAEKKREKFLRLEQMIKPLGPTFELAKIRVELAKLSRLTGDRQGSEQYAREAFAFFKPIAPHCFPEDLQSLLPQEESLRKDRLFRLIIEMGDALTDQENLERLLTNIITSMARLTGSERAALFIRNEGSSELHLAASRNVLKEELHSSAFEEPLGAIRSVVFSGTGDIVQYDTSDHESPDYRRVIITPLRLGKKIIGALYQDSRFFSVDTDSDNIQLLSAFASQIAVSIDRARAYDEIARLNRKLIQENLYYIEEKEEFRPFGEIIGSSAVIHDLQRLIRKVAPTQSTVLIHGETGVGKELVARAIHRESDRKEGPFIRVNCAALPETIVDSELFGYEKGAFTGAVKTKEGRFELAHRGTIFLDEVSELPLATQSRLLRILQEKEFQRVGGTKTLQSDFRLITATNKALNAEVQEGRFRADLFFRLNVFPMYVPPLRERTEDIPELAMHFLRLYESRSNRRYSGIPALEMKKLQTYSWPGNIRELSNMIERAVILGGSRIGFPELDSHVQQPPAPLNTDGMKLKDMERLHILDALEKTGGKIGGGDGAAHLLGLNRTTLIMRMKKLGIEVARKPKLTNPRSQAEPGKIP